jgi:hypothetical protein
VHVQWLSPSKRIRSPFAECRLWTSMYVYIRQYACASSGRATARPLTTLSEFSVPCAGTRCGGSAEFRHLPLSGTPDLAPLGEGRGKHTHTHHTTYHTHVVHTHPGIGLRWKRLAQGPGPRTQIFWMDPSRGARGCKLVPMAQLAPDPRRRGDHRTRTTSKGKVFPVGLVPSLTKLAIFSSN